MRYYANGVLLLSLLIGGPSPLYAEESSDLAPLKGSWEGPWYRGMTSGKAALRISDEGATVQFTNLDKFGGEVHPLKTASIEEGVLKLRTEGEAGGALTASLKLNEAKSEMKGLGKFDGFPLRFELKKVGR